MIQIQTEESEGSADEFRQVKKKVQPQLQSTLANGKKEGHPGDISSSEDEAEEEEGEVKAPVGHGEKRTRGSKRAAKGEATRVPEKNKRPYKRQREEKGKEEEEEVEGTTSGSESPSDLVDDNSEAEAEEESEEEDETPVKKNSRKKKQPLLPPPPPPPPPPKRAAPKAKKAKLEEGVEKEEEEEEVKLAAAAASAAAVVDAKKSGGGKAKTKAVEQVESPVPSKKPQPPNAPARPKPASRRPKGQSEAERRRLNFTGLLELDDGDDLDPAVARQNAKIRGLLLQVVHFLR